MRKLKKSRFRQCDPDADYQGSNDDNNDASSDIDVVFFCDEPTRDAMDNLNRLARDITRTLARDIDGEFVFRVDTRLRPYGDAGPMVPTLDFIEQYFVAQGRMWERLAWLKARVATGRTWHRPIPKDAFSRHRARSVPTALRPNGRSGAGPATSASLSPSHAA